jgi:hypothetical protein
MEYQQIINPVIYIDNKNYEDIDRFTYTKTFHKTGSITVPIILIDFSFFVDLVLYKSKHTIAVYGKGLRKNSSEFYATLIGVVFTKVSLAARGPGERENCCRIEFRIDEIKSRKYKR